MDQNEQSQLDLKNPFEEATLDQAKAMLTTAQAKLTDQHAASEKSNNEMRIELSKEIKSVFGKLNISVFVIIAVLALIDVALVVSGKEAVKDRLISEKVLLALMAGTVAQAGAAFIAIVGYLFPKKSEGEQIGKSTSASSPILVSLIGGAGLGLFLGVVMMSPPVISDVAAKSREPVSAISSLSNQCADRDAGIVPTIGSLTIIQSASGSTDERTSKLKSFKASSPQSTQNTQHNARDCGGEAPQIKP